MNKKIVIIIPIIIAGIIVVSGFSGESDIKDEPPFHITLASPEQYPNGVYSNNFEIKKGDYFFRFVPNGDSPETLSISLNGEEFSFSEDFKLKGELHETGISEYYTWDYEGKKAIQVPSDQEISILINPNGNVLGSVSVDLIEN